MEANFATKQRECAMRRSGAAGAGSRGATGTAQLPAWSIYTTLGALRFGASKTSKSRSKYSVAVCHMSVFIDWNKLVEDDSIETQLRDFLDEQFSNISLPTFIQSLRISSLKLGKVAPEVTIRHISDPFPEFYQMFESDDSGSKPELDEDARQDLVAAIHESLKNEHTGGEHRPAEPHQSPFDTQMVVEIKYSGDMELGVSATLLVNYPSPNFISLPLAFDISGIEIHSLAVVAAIQNRISLSILCDVDSNDQMSSDTVKVIRTMTMRSKIGDASHNGAVLRNVGRVEKFILEQLRKVIRDELVWPGWITIEL